MRIIETVVRDPDNRVRYLHELEISLRLLKGERVEFFHQWEIISHVAGEEVLAQTVEGSHLMTALNLHFNSLQKIDRTYNLKFLGLSGAYNRKVIPEIIKDSEIDEYILDYTRKNGETKGMRLHEYILGQFIQPARDDKTDKQKRIRYKSRLRGRIKRAGRVFERNQVSGT